MLSVRGWGVTIVECGDESGELRKCERGSAWKSERVKREREESAGCDLHNNDEDRANEKTS